MTEQQPIYDRERTSLKRELLAILTLYAIGVVLPVLIGFAFGPESA